jgi:hypothetical protein
MSSRLIATRDRAVAMAQKGHEVIDEDHPSVAFEVNATGRILTASGQVERLTGLPTTQLAGLAVEALLPMEERPRFAQLLADAATASSGVAGFTLVHGQERVPCEVSWWATDRAPGEGRLRALFCDSSQPAS